MSTDHTINSENVIFPMVNFILMLNVWCFKGHRFQFKARVGSYLYDAMTDGAVWLPAHQQQADHHHHGDCHGHHQQPHHGAAVKCLQGVGLLWKEDIKEGGRGGRRLNMSFSFEFMFFSSSNSIFFFNQKCVMLFIFSPDQFISRNLRRLVDDLLELCRGVDLSIETMNMNKGSFKLLKR